MKQEEKELLLKDLCARLPYGIKCRYQHIQYIENGKIIDINMFGIVNVDGHVKDICDVKPYLFPLSSMTIEQEKELSKLGVSYGEYALHDDIRGLGIYVDEAYIFFEFCYKHHIDFLGLIEMGLANDATGLNIY